LQWNLKMKRLDCMVNFQCTYILNNRICQMWHHSNESYVILLPKRTKKVTREEEKKERRRRRRRRRKIASGEEKNSLSLNNSEWVSEFY